MPDGEFDWGGRLRKGIGGCAVFSPEPQRTVSAEQILGIQSPGYGVHNVYERIKLLYKENGAMRIVSEEGRGTMVEIRIPEKQEMEYEGRI